MSNMAKQQITAGYAIYLRSITGGKALSSVMDRCLHNLRGKSEIIVDKNRGNDVYYLSRRKGDEVFLWRDSSAG